ncbi:PucR family transcriptional regulator [Herbihabitans rhizosphaerae]|uniref:PucR family transcriptional regulator n=1 Tax=Herbihabitans rhizosphaerae TaxID=1872711 RepID=UPI0013EEC913|nr:PucR family transcriptional regulator [Herbihabitans rhizosphaerae]
MPRGIVDGFRPHAPHLARDVVTAIRQAVPEYDAPLSGPFGEIMKAAVQAGTLRCVDMLADPNAPQDDWTPVFRGIGKTERAEGRSLESLQAAYRAGGQVAWRHVSRYLRSHGAPPDLLRWAAESISKYLTMACGLSTDSYLLERADHSDTVEVSRRQLVRLMLADTATDERTLTGAARAANWELPERVTVVALSGPTTGRPNDLGPAVLADFETAEPCLIVPAGDPALRTLTAALPRWRAAIGPAVPIADAAASLRVARRALTLAERGLITPQPVIDCADHPLPLTLFADDLLIDQIIDRRLAPLRTLTDRQQHRLLVTLHEWLSSRGRVAEVAERLRLHPQSVRYRVNKLQELFGDSLTDPQGRFELELAARAKLLLTGNNDAVAEEELPPEEDSRAA